MFNLVFVDERFPGLSRASSHRCMLSGLQVLREIPQDKLYSDEIEDAWSVIKEYRRDVVLDHDAKSSIRFMAVSSFLGKHVLHFLGRAHAFIDKG